MFQTWLPASRRAKRERLARRVVLWITRLVGRRRVAAARTVLGVSRPRHADVRGDAPQSLGGPVTLRPRGPEREAPRLGSRPAACPGRDLCTRVHRRTAAWRTSLPRSRKTAPSGDQGALRALTDGAVVHPAGMAPRAPTRRHTSGRSSTTPGPRRTSRPPRRPGGADRDTTVRVDGPGWCLWLRVRRTTSRGLAALLIPLLIGSVGSCTGTVHRPPDSPQPQTPTSSRDPGSDVGPQLVPSEPPSQTVRFYDMHTDGPPAKCAPADPEVSCDDEGVR